MSENANWKKLNCILLVDDDPATNYLHQLTLEQMDIAHEIRVVYSGKEAMEYLTCGKDAAEITSNPFPDLIFLDINMPMMDGWQFLDVFQETFRGEGLDTVICMLSTDIPQNMEERIAAKAAPVHNFFEKPLQTDLVFPMIRSFFPEYLAQA